MAMVAGDCGGVRVHGTFEDGSIKGPGRSTAVLVCAGSGSSMSDDMAYA